jgi:hypothetical protein
MNNNIKIWYNNKDAFEGLCPTPFVSISNDYIDFGTKWNQITNIRLEGQITGAFIGNLSYGLLNDATRALHDNFSENYKTLLITENGQGLYTGNNAIIKSINIEDSQWYGVLPFNIDISVYNSNLFQDYFGITDPEENFSFKEEEGDLLLLTHSLSAKGFNANNKNAIQNAKDWVLPKISNFNNIYPFLIKNAGAVKNRPFLLYSSKEVIDRFNGTYSWEGTYKKSLNLENPNNCFLKYSVDLNSGIEDGFVFASIDGSLEGNTLNILRDEYNKLNLHNLCNQISSQVFGENLSTRAISKFVEESSEENNLNFKATFNNDYSNEVVNNYTIDLKEDTLKCLRTANISANISCRYGDLSTKWQKVNTFYKSNFSPFNLVNTEFKKDFGNFNLNPTPTSESITFDEFNAQINYSAEFSDKAAIFSSDILNLSSSVTYNPSIKIHAPKTSAFVIREHNVQNLQSANRAKIDISVTAVAKINKSISTALTLARSEINRIKSNYTAGAGNILLENSVVSEDNDIKSVTINETWTFEGTVIS